MATQIRDPIHNFISLNDEEIKIIDTRSFQRLRGIHQLACAYLVYPGAVHTRFEHSLGVAHVAGNMAKILEIDDDRVRIVRLAALLHDLGHGPFSHISEPLLERYADKKKLPADQKTSKIHELITAEIIKSDKQITKIIGSDAAERITQLLEKGFSKPALKSIVSGPIDADKQDYLLRDSFFCGVKYGIFDIHQLHRSITLVGNDYDEQLMVKSDGVFAVEQYILAKYYLTANVLLHRVRLITDEMIKRAIILGIEKDEIKDLHKIYSYDGTNKFIENYKKWNDSSFLNKFCLDCRKKTLCKELLEGLVNRNLLKRIFKLHTKNFESNVSDAILSLFEPSRREDKANIEKMISQELAKCTKSEVNPDFVILNLNKIGNVRKLPEEDESEILVDDSPRPPKPFREISTLFKSISLYTDEFIEVYAPLNRDPIEERKKICDALKNPIKELIEKYTPKTGGDES
ncbi:MAG: HD domain-containing protein [Candidatus Omnitrophica bacterium]|nr:HD domain-containing protein [Candidatus Omnitrophota bacterium]